MENENQDVEVKATDTEKTAEKPVEKAKTYTQDEVKEMITKRLERERKNQTEQINKAKDEATKLAKMNSDQKKDYELEKANQARDEALAKLQRYEMRDQARDMLSENNLSLTDKQLDLVVTENAESTKANVEMLAEIAKSIREEVRDEFRKGKTPRTNNEHITREQIEKIQDPVERVNMIRTHMNLFN